jgi:hypothetical protein
MSIKWWALIIWSIAFLVGLVVLLYRFDAAGLAPIATRRMSVNHLLQADDLKGRKSSDFVGMYLRMNVVQGEIVTPHDVSMTPVLYSDGSPWFAFSTPADAVRQGSIDAKSKGQICNHSESIAPAEVVALFCPTVEDGRPCLALVSVAAADVDKLSKEITSNQITGGPGSTPSLFKPSCK